MKRLARSILSVILTVALLLSLQVAPTAVWAAERETPQIVTASASYINPMYVPQVAVISEEETPISYTAEVGESQVETLRNAMKNRATTATIQFTIDATYDPQDPDAFWNVAKAVEREIFNEALAHTGNPKEGDYIRCNYYRRSMNFQASLGTVATITSDYNFEYHANAAQEQAVDSKVAQLLAELDVSCASDYEKVCAAYDWLCNNVDYSDPIQSAPSTDYSSYGALVEKDCVCQGYAAAYYRLMLELGVDCRVISGVGGGGGHAWNIVKLGGAYYNADATWDTSWLEAGLPYEWFLRCDTNFPDHLRDAEFDTESFHAAYPMAQKDYEPPITGTCGENLTWTLDSTGLLTISGTGATANYMSGGEEPWPWDEYRADIVSVVIEEGVTELNGYHAFAGCQNLQSVTLPSSLTMIGFAAFGNCDKLERVELPVNLALIGTGAFNDCDGLSEMRIPANVIRIAPESFSDCANLENVVISADATSIAYGAFSGCSKLSSVTFEGAAPSVEEDAFLNVTAEIYYPAGDSSWTEDVMQDYGGDITWVSYEKETEPFALSGTSVSLGDSLDMHFFVDPSHVDAGCYAVLTRYYSNGTDEVAVTVPYSQWNALDDGRLYITYDNIAAKEMGDYVTVEIFNGSGEAISQLHVDSVKSYATRMLDKEEVVANEKLRTLYVDMLNYGAAAQAQFGYNVTMPANDLLTEEQLAWATDSYETESNLVSGTGRAGTALTLKSRITLDFIFKNTAIGSDYTGLYAVASYTDHYGRAVETRIDGIKFYNENYGYVSVPGLSVADYGQAVTCTVYDAEGNVLAWATDSIEGYAHRMAGKLPQIVDTIMKFGASSYSFFE